MPSTGWVSEGISAIEPARAQPRHGVGRGADPGQDARGSRAGCDPASRGHFGAAPEALQGELQRGDVGAAAGDDDDVAQRSQHALGARQLAALAADRLPQARPTPLKQDSTM